MKNLISEARFREKLGGIGRTAFWRQKNSDPNFPVVVPVSPGLKRYVEEEVDEYIERLISRRDGRAA